MYQLAVLFLTAVLAGFALILVTEVAAAFLTSATIVNILVAIGAIAVIVFAFAILVIATKTLLNKCVR
ncbi:hypothetical protein GLV94_19195 [Virgibacillus halodenitrificans]|uniref:hypothetical protein n=1 Tax=Virgibacillus halodenitrificans TaxID=1482 RepID=UPI0013710659|nr:hypothetical protein [Virgibacillus halodenitrificans]MYL47769.1 hypothetical protein [Virgibacillus halodenitrificans]